MTVQTNVIRVINPGFLTTVQDLGRPRQAHLGISASGAADALSMRIGNLLVGNHDATSALEMTLTGGIFEFEVDTLVALTGSDFIPKIGGESVPLWTSIVVRAGQTLQMEHTLSGARGYLCVRGGFQCKPFFGSVSTHLLTGIGGIEGRPLRRGDVLLVPATGKTTLPPARRLPTKFVPATKDRGQLRVTPGPQKGFFSSGSRSSFFNSTYTVSEYSNRMGLRLVGPSLVRKKNDDMLTEGVSLGAIQVPQSGQPIILFVEHQTTGGYPKIANVISADIHRLGQLRPRDEVHFEEVSFDHALEILREQEATLQSLVTSPA